MKGYKAFNADLTCRGMQYEVGKIYEMEESPICCGRGYHFCKNMKDVYNYYSMSDDTRICEVVSLGEVVTDDDKKYCTNKIKIVREIKNKAIKHCNIDKTDVGYCNSGYLNSGNRNSGHNNSGDCNSGDRNSGSWNSGSWNSGDCNSGVFNTLKNPTIKMFDKESNWTIQDWFNSKANEVLRGCPYTYSGFVSNGQMTDEEKERHPEYKTIGGYVKVFVATKEDKQKWWDSLSEEDKQECYELPNFDADKFVECLGIKHL